jgi:hypothetical protein
MNAAETKDNLYKLIAETDDINVLNEIQTYFNILKSKSIDWWDMLTEKEKINIETGMQQLASGKRIPHSHIRKSVNKLIAT